MADDKPLFDEEASLLAFLAERDHPCPACGYNLRGLQNPTCPECGSPLHLTVGKRHMPVHWLLLTMIPLAGAGLLGVLFLVVLLVILAEEGRVGHMPPEPMVILAMGLASAVACAVLFAKRTRFLHMEVDRQKGITAGVWILFGLGLLLVFAMIFG